jgi:hypothetical protein
MSARRLALASAAATCIAFGIGPVAALATTGTDTDKRTTVTITHTGVTYKPSLSKMKLKTGVTLRLHIVNKAKDKHWFKFGTHRTKVLKPGQAFNMYYVLDTPGKYPWKVELGHPRGKHFHGVYVLQLPNHFH